MSDRTSARDRGTVTVLLRVGLAVGLALMATGLILALIEGRLMAHSVTLGQIPDLLAHGRPSAFMAAGVLVLLATPIARVMALMVLFARQDDRRFAVVATVVALLLALGTLLGRF
jgi:uncharacterized membrane protein